MWLHNIRRHKVPQSHRADKSQDEQLGGTNHIHDLTSLISSRYSRFRQLGQTKIFVVKKQTWLSVSQSVRQVLEKYLFRLLFSGWILITTDNVEIQTHLCYYILFLCVWGRRARALACACAQALVWYECKSFDKSRQILIRDKKQRVWQIWIKLTIWFFKVLKCDSFALKLTTFGS